MMKKEERIGNIICAAILVVVAIVWAATLVNDFRSIENNSENVAEYVDQLEEDTDELVAETMEYLDSDEYVMDLVTSGELCDWIMEDLGVY